MNSLRYRKLTRVRIISVILITLILMVLYGLKINKDKPSNADIVSTKSYANSIVNDGVKNRTVDTEKFEVVTVKNDISDSKHIIVIIRINSKFSSWDAIYEFTPAGKLSDYSIKLAEKFQVWLTAGIVCLLISIVFVELGYRFFKKK